MLSDNDKRRLKEYIERYKKDWRSDVRENAKSMIEIISARDPEEAKKIKLRMGYKDAKMNKYNKFIDSVIGNIARKIEDEFNENDHPRDKGGKFTTKGGEGKGGAKEERGEGGLHHAGKDVEKFGENLKKKREGVIKKQKERRGFSELEETETEKAAKEELGSTKSDEETLEGLDDYGEKLLEYASDLDTANEALRALNWDSHDYDDLEQAQTALKEAISQNPKKAKELWENTTEESKEIKGYSYKEDVDTVVKEFSESGIDLYAALEDLGIESNHIPEGYLEEVLADELYDNPKLLDEAKDYIKRYTSGN